MLRGRGCCLLRSAWTEAFTCQRVIRNAAHMTGLRWSRGAVLAFAGMGSERVTACERLESRSIPLLVCDDHMLFEAHLRRFLRSLACFNRVSLLSVLICACEAHSPIASGYCGRDFLPCAAEPEVLGVSVPEVSIRRSSRRQQQIFLNSQRSTCGPSAKQLHGVHPFQCPWREAETFS